MGRPILPHSDTVMGEHIGHRQLHQRCQTRHGLRVIAEHEERGHKRPHPVQRQAVPDRRHRQLPHAKVQVPSCVVIFREIPHIAHIGLGGRSQVGCAANEVRHQVLKLLKLLAG